MAAYETVIGLEIHVELKTESKIFCSCPTTFGAAPNTQVCPVCLGMPGTLPVLNEKVVDYAVKAGLATNCEIAGYSKQDRKNYVYPDLPKAYQISQYDLPLCEHGWLNIATKSGEKRIGITRIHIEEDAGKLVHDPDAGTLIDCNRCGVPLIEIVTEPDIRSAEEAVAFLEKLRSTIIYTGISDCKMNEGSLRCDVNLSIRPKGQEAFGTRTETKNLNSFQSVRRAIEYETSRQIRAVEAGERIVQATMRFDAATGKTSVMRSKENANDYRYFPDPDLAAIELPASRVEELRQEIPMLPEQRQAMYVERFSLTAYDASVITAEPAIAEYFEAAAAATPFPKLAANLLITDIFRLRGGEEGAPPIAPTHLAALATLLGQGEISSSAGKRVLSALWEKDESPEAVVDRLSLRQISDDAALRPAVEQVLAENPAAVADFRAGKQSAIKALMGKAMQATGGKGNPARLQELLQQALKEK